ncbi:aldehyde dehydrogenase (NADP(+)) [Actinophytocola glycyrrhizae]|uniref:aldehyde dehydrogenase (NADP(+)) n=1 Tax=Actinophytocola glycyrrhizae TaxID=2044873 RepID=UPI00366A6FDB
MSLETVLTAADAARAPFAATTAKLRAAALRRVADVLDAAAGELVPLAHLETHLPEKPRLHAELERTTFQLRLLAETVVEGGYLSVTIDSPDTCWPAGGRADLRRMLVPAGPVAVFAASNFPFAFGVAGGDTAAALAVGCPVVLKASPGHPLLSGRVGELVSGALSSAGLPDGVFGVVHGVEEGRALVVDPRIRAGAFTGSRQGGRALFDLACSRPDPIPFHAEMGSVNPVFVTASAAAERAEGIAEGYVASYTLGAGQFCTKPGLVFVPAAAAADFESHVAAALAGHVAAPLLNDGITARYTAELDTLRSHPAVRVPVAGEGVAPTLLGCTAADFLAAREELLVECFGPTSMVVRYSSADELLACARAFTGELSAAVHGAPDDAEAGQLVALLTERVGRVLWNDWPTGVSVTYAMQHGGPYPATTMPGHTSVGTTALRRFLRPVVYQNMPQALLPEVLRDGNPLEVPRRVDGVLSRQTAQRPTA